MRFDANDEPFDGIDANCDGSDGDASDAIHVALWGASGATGSDIDPIRDIQEGVDEAVNQGLSYVLVSQGAYYESVEMEPGVSLVGGYSYFFDEYDADAYETTIDGDNTTAAMPGTITLACSTGLEQRIQGFHVIGTYPDDDGESSYGIYLDGCDADTTIASNDIEGRPGADGTDGVSGANGDDGVAGDVGVDVFLTNCAQDPEGGLAGTKTCSAPSINEVVDGGDGGDTLCAIIYAGWTEAGYPGSGVGPGAGGDRASHGYFSNGGGCLSCSVSTYFGPGGNGEYGDHGAHGTAGAACGSPGGAVSGGLFEGSTGGDGSVADNGSGAGGGGAGAGAENHPSCDAWDVSGGRGGGGGRGAGGAEGGYAGSGAGGSFGIFYYYDSAPTDYPSLSNNEVAADYGGEGGWGGNGGVGGDGGLGGMGGQATAGFLVWAGQIGGNGGNGGDGGHGGGGGGGCGGPSYSLYVYGDTPDPAYGAGNTLSYSGGGAGGTGGYGPGGTDGGDGSVGDDGDKNF